MKCNVWLTMCLGALMVPLAIGTAGARSAELKTESFDRDPQWEGHNNRIVPKEVKPLEQDFDYSPTTNFAGKSTGEIGGVIWRAPTRASYAAKISPKTINDKLSASGT